MCGFERDLVFDPVLVEGSEMLALVPPVFALESA